MKFITRTIKFGVYLLMGGLFIGITAFFVVPPAFDTGPFMIKIVQSGSMEPAIATGAVVLIKTGATYDIGDVITFKSNGSETPTTHRVVGYEEINGVQHLVTKGDANEERDAELVAPNAVIGTVYFSVPRIGFILDFARQPMGFALLIGLPAALIILDELEKIYRVLRGGQTSTATPATQPALVRTAPPRRRTIIIGGTSSRALCTLEVAPYQKSVAQPPKRRSIDGINKRSMVGATTMMLFLGVILMNPGSTISYLQDIEASLANEFISTEVDFSVSADTTLFEVEVETVVPDQNQLTITVFDTSPLVYDVSTSFMGGDSSFCAGITLQSTDGVVYDGPILSLDVASPLAIASPLTFSFSYDATTTIADGSVCLVDVIVSGYDEASVQVPFAYQDTETVSLTFIYDDGIIEVPAALFNTLFVSEPVTEPEPDLEVVPEPELPSTEPGTSDTELPSEPENTEPQEPIQEPEPVTEPEPDPEMQNEPTLPTELE